MALSLSSTFTLLLIRLLSDNVHVRREVLQLQNEFFSSQKYALYWIFQMNTPGFFNLISIYCSVCVTTIYKNVLELRTEKNIYPISLRRGTEEELLLVNV